MTRLAASYLALDRELVDEDSDVRSGVLVGRALIAWRSVVGVGRRRLKRRRIGRVRIGRRRLGLSLKHI
jgi:hypothetical protein